MLWFWVTIFAYFLNAISQVIDKTLLKKDIPNPIVYTFYIALLGTLLIIFILPFAFGIPTWLVILVGLIAGIVFVWALILLFQALQKDEVSRVVPMVGGLTPIFVLILAWYVLEEQLTQNQYLAFIFLILGTFLISLDFQEHGALSWLKRKLGLVTGRALPQIRRTLWLALPSAVFFGVAYILSKYVYSETQFWTGFIWIKFGSFLAVILLLLSAKNRRAIGDNFKKIKKTNKQQTKIGFRFLFGQACAGAKELLLQYAIFLGPVTLVSALQGSQYVFVFIIVVLLTLFLPKILKEGLSKEVVWQKIVAILLIIVGLYLVAV